MTVDESRALLTCACKWPVVEQHAKRDLIVLAFSEFWRSNPTMTEFAEYTSGLVLSPEMLWLMVKGAH